MNQVEIDQPIPGQTKPRRPTFLTVLCILTFVVSGYSVFNGMVGLIFSGDVSASDWSAINQQMSDAMQSADAQTAKMLRPFLQAAAETITQVQRFAVALSAVQILVALLGILGAYMMWRLRKRGYFIYVIAKIIGVGMPLAMIGINMLTAMVYGLAAVVSLVMVILYGMNRKHLH